MLGIKRMGPLVGALAMFVLAWPLHTRLLKQHDAHDRLQQAYVPEPWFLRWSAMGYLEALGDLAWVRAVVYSGNRLDIRFLSSIERLAAAVTALNPRLHRAYVWAGVAPTALPAPRITRPMLDLALDIYARGLTQFPESHELLLSRGVLQLNDVQRHPDFPPEEKAAAKAEGAANIRKAAAFGGDVLVQQYAASIIGGHESRELALRFLQAQFAAAEDDDLRELLLSKITELGGRTSLDEIRALKQAFLARRQAALPYVPPPLFAVLERPGGPRLEP